MFTPPLTNAIGFGVVLLLLFILALHHDERGRDIYSK